MVDQTGRVRIEFDSADRLSRCVAVGPDGEEVELPITGVEERADATGSPAVVMISLHRMRVDHRRTS